MLLEAQLEKQLESINISQSCAEEMEQVFSAHADTRTYFYTYFL